MQLSTKSVTARVAKEMMGSEKTKRLSAPNARPSGASETKTPSPPNDQGREAEFQARLKLLQSGISRP